jgi:poly(hydroxyalkanoate) granule-associated protein
MVKKLDQLAGDSSETNLVATIADSAQQIWLAGLGAFAKAQEEGNKVFEALVKEGQAIEEKTRKLAGDRISDVREKATGTWGKLEQVFEERVARALHSLSVPTKKDIDTLNQRVSELTEIAKKLSAAMDDKHEGEEASEEKAPVRKRTAKAAE